MSMPAAETCTGHVLYVCTDMHTHFSTYVGMAIYLFCIRKYECMNIYVYTRVQIHVRTYESLLVLHYVTPQPTLFNAIRSCFELLEILLIYSVCIVPYHSMYYRKIALVLYGEEFIVYLHMYYHIIPCHITFYKTILCCFISDYLVLYHIKLCYGIFC